MLGGTACPENRLSLSSLWWCDLASVRTSTPRVATSCSGATLSIVYMDVQALISIKAHALGVSFVTFNMEKQYEWGSKEGAREMSNLA